jgi:hypothetical protein
MRRVLGVMRSYAQEMLMAPPGEEDDYLFPISLGLAHELVHFEHERATGAGVGAQGGSTVGDHFRSMLGVMATMGFPIEATSKQLESAAPKGMYKPRVKAGTFPLAAKCQFEHFARDAANVALASARARTAVSFLCRSYLAAGLDQSLRLGAEGMRVTLHQDEEHPFVMAGTAYVTKDGHPIEFYAPAEGLLGGYEWYGEHLAEVLELGQVFPKWSAEPGARGSILAATALRRAVADPAAIRAAVIEVLSLPPLAYTPEDTAAMNVNGHSGHVTEPDWSRAIGERPHFAFELSDGLEHGFTDSCGGDSDCLGHWLRDAGAKESATAAQAAAEAASRGSSARMAAAQAAQAGRRGSAGAMRIYYGMSGALGNRVGERFKQLDVRQRLVRTIREILSHWEGGWLSLPRGQLDLKLLRSVRGRPAARP